MSNLVEAILKEKGPCISSDLTKTLIEEYQLSSVAARQQVSRCKVIKRLAYVKFPRNARFLYLQNDFSSQRYWQRLREAFRISKSCYSYAFEALFQRGGIMPLQHFNSACGAPMKQKNHLSPEQIIENLKKATVCGEIEVNGVGRCVYLICLLSSSPEETSEFSSLRARLITEKILLIAIKNWVRNLGIVSYNSVALRDESKEVPKVGTFLWDLTGPSYLAPMLTWGSKGNQKNGFLACDVLLEHEITTNGISPFLNKCTTIRSLKNIGKCLQIFVAEKYTHPAFQELKRLGVIAATTESLFGTDIAKALKQLTKILAEAAIVCVKPEVLGGLIQQLSKIEGASVNLRGALFEFIVADIVRKKMLAVDVRMNQIIKDEKGNKAEIDVLAIVGRRSAYFIECKGYQPSGTVDSDDIDRWLYTRIPLVRNYALSHPEWKFMELHFELWTTGNIKIDDESKIIKRANASRFLITFCNAEAVLESAKATKDHELINTLKQHFIEHPMATIEIKVEQQRRRVEMREQWEKSNSHLGNNSSDIFDDLIES